MSTEPKQKPLEGETLPPRRGRVTARRNISGKLSGSRNTALRGMRVVCGCSPILRVANCQ